MRAKEFIIQEDEYSAVQNKLGKNPMVQKVNALTYNVTDPNTRYLNKMGEMSPQELALWKARAGKLLARTQALYAKLKAIVPPEEQSALNSVKLTVPLNGEMSWAAADFDNKTISIDVGCFWDLSDDCLAYVLGHEIGHLVWAFGPKKNWPKTRGQKFTPAQRRQEEYDADVYGCKLAMQLGYDRRKAWDHFTVAYQREPFDPAYPQYPSVGQRKANVEKDIKNQAAAAPTMPAPQPTPAPQQAQEPAQPNPDTAEKNAWLGHIMNGMRKFEVALASDPTIAQA